jgi:orotate phosphoribosyltransferase
LDTALVKQGFERGKENTLKKCRGKDLAVDRDEILKVFEDNNALLEGHFELRSGLHSAKYCQVARLQQNPRLLGTLCAALLEKMEDVLGEELTVDTVIAPAMGGITIGHEVARSLGTRYIFAEKENDRLVLRRGQEISAGEKFIIIEDVVTRGGRVQETYDIVTKRGGVVNGIGVLFDRSGGEVSFDAPFISLLQMTPVVWEPDECPLCRDGVPMEHPGS